MELDSRLGTVEDVLDGVAEPLQAIIAHLRAVILQVDPDATEQPRPTMGR